MARTTVFFVGLVAMAAQAQTYTVLHRFGGSPDGAAPLASLIADPAGNLFGTTSSGGTSGWGTVFQVGHGGQSVLYSFPVGAAQETYGGSGAGLIRDAAGSFYGTTREGGAFGQGTVFKLDRAGAMTVLYTFTGGADGGFPLGGVVRDSAGNLYGTTYYGGAFTFTCKQNGCGVVFKLDATGAYTVLYRFVDLLGAQPMAALIVDPEGDLLGTTEQGGEFGWGTVVRIAESGVHVLYSFRGGADGAGPQAGLIRDDAGNLYGTTYHGGAGGGGVVFKVDAAGGETALHGRSRISTRQASARTWRRLKRTMIGKG